MTFALRKSSMNVLRTCEVQLAGTKFVVLTVEDVKQVWRGLLCIFFKLRHHNSQAEVLLAHIYPVAFHCPDVLAAPNADLSCLE